eukprot:754593-Hanusia_phi.AAC.3
MRGSDLFHAARVGPANPAPAPPPLPPAPMPSTLKSLLPSKPSHCLTRLAGNVITTSSESSLLDLRDVGEDEELGGESDLPPAAPPPPHLILLIIDGSLVKSSSETLVAVDRTVTLLASLGFLPTERRRQCHGPGPWQRDQDPSEHFQKKRRKKQQGQRAGSRTEERAVSHASWAPCDKDRGLPEEGQDILEALACSSRGGSLGHGSDTGGILAHLGDTEPGGGVAARLLVGSRPDREGEENLRLPRQPGTRREPQMRTQSPMTELK